MEYLNQNFSKLFSRKIFLCYLRNLVVSDKLSSKLTSCLFVNEVTGLLNKYFQHPEILLTTCENLVIIFHIFQQMKV